VCAQGRGAASSAGGKAAPRAPYPDLTLRRGAQDAGRLAALEAELRRGRRREEKLAAMQFRLREDVAAAGRDAGAFDRLRDVRGLEYELDFVTNRAQRTEQARTPLLVIPWEPTPACARRRPAPAGRGVAAPQPHSRILSPVPSCPRAWRPRPAHPRPCRRSCLWIRRPWTPYLTERGRPRQALKQALTAEQAARAALSAELAKLRGRAGAAEPRRGPPSAGKENVGARG
jgi:hypothetical protein